MGLGGGEGHGGDDALKVDGRLTGTRKDIIREAQGEKEEEMMISMKMEEMLYRWEGREADEWAIGTVSGQRTHRHLQQAEFHRGGEDAQTELARPTAFLGKGRSEKASEEDFLKMGQAGEGEEGDGEEAVDRHRLPPGSSAT